MKKTLFILCALLLTAVGASAQSSWTAPVLPTSTLESDGKYYLYNTEGKMYMGKVSFLWGTEAGFTDSGFLATLTSTGGDVYTIYNNGSSSGYVFFNGTYLYIDGAQGSADPFTFTEASGGTYTIQTASNGYLGYDGTNEIKTTLASTSTGIYWELIAEGAEELYNALVILYNTLVHAESYGMTDDATYKSAGEVYLSSTATADDVMAAVAALEVAMEGYASEDDPDDVTYAYITNPSFDTGDLTGWTTTFWYQSTPHSNEEITISGYAETWVSSADNGKLSNMAFSQTLELPKGTYRLEADVVATNQSNASLTVSGVYLCAGSQRTSVHTGDGLPEHYTVEFYVTNENGESADIGMKIYSTDANWVAVDNFVLYYLGEEVTAVTDTESEYKKGDVIEIDNTTYYVQCDNMVKNHSFELGFDGWTQANDYTTGITFTNFDLRSDGAKDGQAYLVGTTNDGASGAGSLGTAWSIEKGKTYYFSYYVKNLDGTEDTQYLKTSLTSTMGTESSVLGYPSSVSSDWQKVEYSFTNTSDYAYLQVEFRWLESHWGFDNFQLYEIDEELLPVEWTMTEAGYGTIILPFDAVIPTQDDGGSDITWTAYSTGTVTPDAEDSDYTLSLTEASGAIQANTPYIMAGTAGTYTFTGTPEEAENNLTSGKLTGTYETMDCAALLDAAGSNTVYLLQNHDNVVAFYPVVEDASSEATLTPYHCYLTLTEDDLKTTSGAPAKLSFSFGGEATAIEAVEGAEAEGNGAIYDLSGRKVSKAVKGVYIQNGKKVLVK